MERSDFHVPTFQRIRTLRLQRELEAPIVFEIISGANENDLRIVIRVNNAAKRGLIGAAESYDPDTVEGQSLMQQRI